jgi:hypothetical protein
LEEGLKDDECVEVIALVADIKVAPSLGYLAASLRRLKNKE